MTREYPAPLKIQRQREHGGSLIIMAVVGAMLCAFVGTAIFLSMQALLHHELQQAVATSAKVGAANYYSYYTMSNRPGRNPVMAHHLALATFNAVVRESSTLRGTKPTLTALRISPQNDTVTVEAEVIIPTGLLAPIGIERMKIIERETARAMRFSPVDVTGPLVLEAGESRTIEFPYPVVDTLGTDVIIQQDPLNSFEQGYIMEACNADECFDMGSGARDLMKATYDGQKVQVESDDNDIQPREGNRVIFGESSFFLKPSKVNKATSLRVTNANINNYPGISPLRISQISVFGYSGLCISEHNCPLPAGFRPVGSGNVKPAVVNIPGVGN